MKFDVQTPYFTKCCANSISLFSDNLRELLDLSAVLYSLFKATVTFSVIFLVGQYTIVGPSKVNSIFDLNKKKYLEVKRDMILYTSRNKWVRHVKSGLTYNLVYSKLDVI